MHVTSFPPYVNYFNELYACKKGLWLIVLIQGGGNPLLCIQLFKGQTENVWKIDGPHRAVVCRCHHVGCDNIGGSLESHGVWTE